MCIFIIVSMFFNIILLVYIYFSKKNNKRKEECKNKTIYTIRVIISHLKNRKDEADNPETLLVNESLKFINDFLLNELKCGTFSEKGFRVLHSIVISEVPEVCKYYEMDKIDFLRLERLQKVWKNKYIN